MALINKLTAIGDAIRNKNGNTDKLTLDSMVTAINDMADVTIDGVKVTESLSLTSFIYNKDEGSLPFTLFAGAAVVYNNEIHIMGGTQDSYKHYKWNGSSWSSVSTLPFSFEGLAVVYNNEIHIMYDTYHYKWNGSSWSSVSTLPFSFSHGGIVVYNNEIHIMYDTYHYKWDGSSWEKTSTLSKYFYSDDSAVVYNNEIHVFTQGKYHYKWNGSSWSSVSTLPYEINRGSVIVYNNEIHLLGGEGINTGHYKRDGSSWVKLDYLPYTFYRGNTVIYYEVINLLGGGRAGTYYPYHYTIRPSYMKGA